MARSFFVPALAAAAIGGTFWMFGSDGPATDDPAVVGRWNSESARLDLGGNGRYALLVLGTAAGAGMECGRWRAVGGSLQMRVEKGPRHDPGPVGIATLREPRLRAGTYAHQGSRMVAELREVNGVTRAWTFSRGNGDSPVPSADCTAIGESDPLHAEGKSW